LIINLPPRSLKSICASVTFPAFVLGHDPTQRLICVAYSNDLALKHARDFRSIINSPWYKDLFRRTRAVKDTDTEFETTKGGGRLATSIGGTITGRGGSFILIDDPLKAEEALSGSARDKVNDYFRNTLYSRLDSKVHGVIMLVMQRLHEEDLAGYLLKQSGWMHLNLPAIATADEQIPLGGGCFHNRKEEDVLHPAREPRDQLDQTKQLMGSSHFQAQYQQAPVPESGNLIKRDWLRYSEVLPARTGDTRIVQSWDTAMKADQMNDFSVCTTWLENEGNHFLLDVVRKRCEYPALLRLVLEQYHRHTPDTILIEDKGSGTALIQELRQRHHIPTIEIRPEADKTTRFSIASLSFEQGSVYLPKEAPWLGEFLKELLGFPNVTFNDQVDSVSQYLIWDRNRGKGLIDVFWP
jgi:predicted phage terminase large subunit-like protein